MKDLIQKVKKGKRCLKDDAIVVNVLTTTARLRPINNRNPVSMFNDQTFFSQATQSNENQLNNQHEQGSETISNNATFGSVSNSQQLPGSTAINTHSNNGQLETISASPALSSFGEAPTNESIILDILSI